MAAHRLLILDDEIAIAELVERVAVECGFETRLAFDADMFWDAYDDFEPTLILLDLHVPGARDSEIVHALVDRGCTARVMITSGTDTQGMALVEQVGRARGLTMAGAMPKPYRLAELRRRLADLAQAGGA
jgi:DNA-binding response OmpR family regulator